MSTEGGALDCSLRSAPPSLSVLPARNASVRLEAVRFVRGEFGGDDVAGVDGSRKDRGRLLLGCQPSGSLPAPDGCGSLD